MAYIKDIFNTNFLEYASYVIKDRAIPYIYDGLKPVQRRILHSLHEMDDGKFHKVANVVGNTMKYHPHGDASIFAALVTIANKDLFIEKQGNFGNIFTGDPASAARYIECRLTPLAKEVLFNPEVTEYVDSYDSRNREPIVFPAKVPVLLMMGVEGIAVGMATKILPHNFIELLKAEIGYLKKVKSTVYPDFPTGALADVSEYNDGNGKVMLRARLDTGDSKKIVIREIPYGTTTESIINSIEDAVRKNKIKIAGISDYTAENVEIEIQLARGVHTDDVIDSLYAFTDCEISVSTNAMVIKEDKPVIVTVTNTIQFYTEQLVDILIAELKLESEQLNDKLHAKTLEQIFIENRIYKAIESKKTIVSVRSAVSEGLRQFEKQIKREVTEDDIERLLKIPIRRISLFDINRAKQEMNDIKSRLKDIKKLLANIKDYAISFLERLIEKYSDQFPRKTELTSFDRIDVREAAQRNLKLKYDKNTGYLGYDISSGNVLFEVSSYDKILVIRKSGAFSVINAPEKLFADKGMLYCSIFNKDTAADIVYTAVFKQKKTGFPYIKRCIIDKFILDKGYELVPEDARIICFTTAGNGTLDMEYKPKPRIRVTKESFKIEDYLVKGTKSGGIRLATREVKSAKITNSS